MYRALVVERRLAREEFARLRPLLRRISALANLWVRGYAVYPPDLKYFAERAKVLTPSPPGQPHSWLTGRPAFMNAQVLRPGDRDVGRGVVIRLQEGLLKVRRGRGGPALQAAGPLGREAPRRRGEAGHGAG